MRIYCLTRKSSSVFKLFTGLSPIQFDALLVHFSKQLPKASSLRGRKHTLPLAEHKLFFILFYYRHYLVQQLVAVIFGVNQSQISRWIYHFSLVIDSATSGFIRESRIDFELSDQLIKWLLIDATERPINRPKEDQERVYSGKKKRHTIKNQLVVNYINKKILHVSKTVVGKLHDFDLFKKSKKEIVSLLTSKRKNRRIRILTDLGFLGIEAICPDNLISIPNKKSKGKDLTEAEKQQNKIISGYRVRVENVLAALKRFQIIYQKFRGRSELASRCFTKLYPFV
jgi:hypothetical protein